MRELIPHNTGGLPLFRQAASRLREVGIVLDVGAGIRPQALVRCREHVCAEPFRDYSRVLQAHGYRVIQTRAGEAVELIEAVDTVVALDVIEHMERHEGEAFIALALAKAREQVVVFTPLGFMPQDDGDGRDAWGMKGADWQRHRSGWLPEDFPGWQIFVDPQFHKRQGHGAFFAIHG